MGKTTYTLHGTGGLQYGSKLDVILEPVPAEQIKDREGKRVRITMDLVACVDDNTYERTFNVDLDADDGFGTILDTSQNRLSLYGAVTMVAKNAVYGPRKGNLRHLGSEEGSVKSFLMERMKTETGINPEPEKSSKETPLYG